MAIHPSGYGFAVGTESGTLAFWNSGQTMPIWMVTIPEILISLNPEEDMPFGSKPLLKIGWSISAGSSKLVTLAGDAGSTQIVIIHLLQQSLTFEGPPTVNYMVIYDHPNVDIRDFVVMEETSQILILTANNEVQCIPVPPYREVGAKKVMRLGKYNGSPSISGQSVYLPMQLRPSIELHQTISVPHENFRRLTGKHGDIERGGLAKGGIARPSKKKVDQDARLLKVLGISFHCDISILIDNCIFATV
jgi:hypothetical protein